MSETLGITPDQANLALARVVAQALGQLRDSLVFVGGCATGLLVTAVRAQPIRMTDDVDLVAHVISRAEYHQLEARFCAIGLSMTPARKRRFAAGNVRALRLT